MKIFSQETPNITSNAATDFIFIKEGGLFVNSACSTAKAEAGAMLRQLGMQGQIIKLGKESIASIIWSMWRISLIVLRFSFTCSLIDKTTLDDDGIVSIWKGWREMPY
jgi:hypothetical protein